MIRSMKTLVAALGVTAMLAGASAAQAADSVQVDLTGTGSNWQTINSIDLNVGNTLAVGGQNAAVGESFDVYFQTNVSALNLSGGGVVAGVGTTYNLTTVVKFSEQKAAEGANFAFFAEGAGASEYFELWLTPAAGNDLAGTGFGDDAGGAILLLAGSNVNVIDLGSFVTTGVIENFDGTADGNQYPGVTSVRGTGATTVQADIDFVNANYFRGLTANDTISLVLASGVSTSSPFTSVNPSQQFWDSNTNSYVGTDIGSVNGQSGPDFQFQSNGNLDFGVTSNPIPEPATAAMGLFGLAGLALAARRRR